VGIKRSKGVCQRKALPVNQVDFSNYVEITINSWVIRRMEPLDGSVKSQAQGALASYEKPLYGSRKVFGLTMID